MEVCTEEALDEKEIEYILLYDTMNRDYGYNLESGGSSNKHMSEESKKKMSEAKQGMYDGNKNPMYGVHIKHSEEWKKEQSERVSGKNNPMYGKKVEHTEEARQKLSERMRGEKNPFYNKQHTEQTKHKMRQNNKKQIPVKCIETGIIYPSACEASRQTGIYATSIMKCCTGKQHTSGGLHWEHAA